MVLKYSFSPHIANTKKQQLAEEIRFFKNEVAEKEPSMLEFIDNNPEPRDSIYTPLAGGVNVLHVIWHNVWVFTVEGRYDIKEWLFLSNRD